ncbi:MAG: hypothetical protein ACOY3P_23275 [Planctomycetota bacterium]
MSRYVETPTRTFIADEAIGAFLRVAMSSGRVVVADDDDLSIGTAEAAAWAQGDRVPVRMSTAQGTRKMVCAGQISAGAAVYAAAAGMIAAAGSVLEGVALEDGVEDAVIEVMPVRDQTAGTIDRTQLTQDDLAVFTVPLTELRATGTLAQLGNAAGTPSGAMGLTPGTHGTNTPIVVGEAANQNSKTNLARLQFVLPPEYVAGETITLRAHAKVSAAPQVGATLDVECFVSDGEAGPGAGDICATAAKNLTTSYADHDFTITPTGLAAGDVLDIEITAVVNDTGGSAGNKIASIGKLEMLLDIQG